MKVSRSRLATNFKLPYPCLDFLILRSYFYSNRLDVFVGGDGGGSWGFVFFKFHSNCPNVHLLPVTSYDFPRSNPAVTALTTAMKERYPRENNF